jgi:hypothetical protein
MNSKTKRKELYLSEEERMRLYEITELLPLNLFRFVRTDRGAGFYLNDHEWLKQNSSLKIYIRENGSASFKLYPQLSRRFLSNGKPREPDCPPIKNEADLGNPWVLPECIGPDGTSIRNGVSTYQKECPLGKNGTVYRLPQNTELPYGLQIIPQGDEGDRFGQHYLISPRVPMPLFDYLKLLRRITKDLKPIKL